MPIMQFNELAYPAHEPTKVFDFCMNGPTELVQWCHCQSCLCNLHDLFGLLERHFPTRQDTAN